MTYYAQYDYSAPQPAPVLGWYDTGMFDYQNLPSPLHLIEISESEWAMHFTNPDGWAISNEKLIEDSTPISIQSSI